jgi:trigger factor
MATQIESTSGLERKLQIAVPMTDIKREVGERLRKLGRTLKMPGFRPGKVPMKMIEQSYGPQVHTEVLGDAVSRAFGSAIEEHGLRVAGQPRIEGRDDAAEDELGFTATFEVYPEVEIGDPATLELERVRCSVGEGEIDKTIEILRKQRVEWEQVERAAQDEDRVTIDFTGTLDGVAFEGGTATDFQFALGEGRMLPDFETGTRGMAPGEHKTFSVTFPDEYGSKDLQGKTAQFEVVLKKVEAPKLPEVNAEFATALGVPDGDLERMRTDIRGNLEREVGQRVNARTKANVMDALVKLAGFDLPKALVDAENAQLLQRAVADLQSRGMDTKQLPEIPPDTFSEQAQRRVRLGLIVGELVREHGLTAKPDQIRKQIETFAQAYEKPGEVIRYYFSDRERQAEVEALVVEQNVVDWALSKGKVSDRDIPFDELMAQR